MASIVDGQDGMNAPARSWTLYQRLSVGPGSRQGHSLVQGCRLEKLRIMSASLKDAWVRARSVAQKQ